MPEITSQIEPSTGPRPSPVPLSIAVLPGLVLMAVGLVVDVAAHAGVLTAFEASAHRTGVLGMALTWLAVVIDGLHHSRRPR